MSLKPLEKYIPENTLPYIEKLISKHHLHIKITNPRLSRLGSFSGNRNNQPNTINISGSLNIYSFLITLIHEIAHMETYAIYKNRVQPHGNEWKRIYIAMMKPLIEGNVFPPKLTFILAQHFRNPKASSTSDINLAMELKKYDKNTEDDPVKILEEIETEGFFRWRDGRVFQKKEKLRKRYLCLDTISKKNYLFSPLAEVLPIEDINEFF